ncbi:MAG: hypothetical protein HY011_08945 [Acidobacteria bacterium]|nr:hypothetical protein [Acidobacteriota bacterium]
MKQNCLFGLAAERAVSKRPAAKRIIPQSRGKVCLVLVQRLSIKVAKWHYGDFNGSKPGTSFNTKRQSDKGTKLCKPERRLAFRVSSPRVSKGCSAPSQPLLTRGLLTHPTELHHYRPLNL